MIEDIFEEQEQTPDRLADLARALEFSEGNRMRKVIVLNLDGKKVNPCVRRFSLAARALAWLESFEGET